MEPSYGRMQYPQMGQDQLYYQQMQQQQMFGGVQSMYPERIPPVYPGDNYYHTQDSYAPMRQPDMYGHGMRDPYQSYQNQMTSGFDVQQTHQGNMVGSSLDPVTPSNNESYLEEVFSGMKFENPPEIQKPENDSNQEQENRMENNNPPGQS